jgi:hypothetical protein
VIVERPRSVRRAYTLLIMSAAVSAGGVVLDLVALARVRAATPALIRASAGVSVDTFDPGDLTVEIRGILHLGLLVAVLCVVLSAASAVVVPRPTQRARYATAAVAVLMVLLIGIALAGSPETLVARDETFAPALQDAIARLVPGWYSTVNSIVTALQVIGLVAIFVYLLRTDAGDYYTQGAGPVVANLSDVLAARTERLRTAPHLIDRSSVAVTVGVGGGGFVTVEAGDRGDLWAGQVEVEDVDVLADPGRIRGLRDRDQSEFDVPSQDDLSRRPADLGGDAGDDRQAEDIDAVHAENCVQAVQAACRYSWMAPPSRSRRRMSKRSRRSGSVIGGGIARRGAA